MKKKNNQMKRIAALCLSASLMGASIPSKAACTDCASAGMLPAVVAATGAAEATLATIAAGFAVFLTQWELFLVAFGTSSSANTKAIVSTLDTLRAQQTFMAKFNEMSPVDVDMRQRMREMDAFAMKDTIDSMPTLERCIELTAAQGRTVAGQATITNAGVVQEVIEQKRISKTSGATALAGAISGRTALGSCSSEDVRNRVMGCSAVGKYPDGDFKVSSVMANMNTDLAKATVNGKKIPMANFTIDEQGQAVATQFISNFVHAKPPLNLTPEVAEKSPAYMALYKAAIGRLDAGINAMTNVVAWKYKPSPAMESLPGYQGFMKYWASQRDTYASLYGANFSFPEKPSEYEILRFEVMKNYADVLGKKSESNGGTDTDKQILEQQIIANYIGMTQIRQNEDIATLLSAMLGHAIAPISEQTLEAERNRAIANFKR